MHYLHTVVKMDERLLLHLPFLIGPMERSQMDSWLPYGERSSFVCIGNGRHLPNVDAIHWLKEAIWPLIAKELPLVSLKVYGAYLPQRIKQLHDPKNRFLVLGRANDAIGVLGEARVSLAPLRFGAGIKGKLTDSMCSGTPSVTTYIGAEGMHDGLPWSGAIADGAMDFAQKAIDLYNNRGAWEQAQRNGIEILKKGYDRVTLEDRFLKKLEKIRTGLEEHRNGNFIGSMLMHHTIASSKYLSKWIEAKNP
jgi:glycosyltransferase involved in cell wall biosynthesis